MRGWMRIRQLVWRLASLWRGPNALYVIDVTSIEDLQFEAWSPSTHSDAVAFVRKWAQSVVKHMEAKVQHYERRKRPVQAQIAELSTKVELEYGKILARCNRAANRVGRGGADDAPSFWTAMATDSTNEAVRSLEKQHRDVSRMVERCECVRREWREVAESPTSPTAERKCIEMLESLGDLLEETDYDEMLLRLVETFETFVANPSSLAPDTDVHNHFALTGAPGTGKTELAKKIAKFMAASGILAGSGTGTALEQVFVEVRPNDFLAEYVGWTMPKTAALLSDHLEKVIFLDEAYALQGSAGTAEGGGGSQSFGKEAATQILVSMNENNGCFSMIVAGYREQIRTAFFGLNVGLQRRFRNQHDLKPSSAETLVRVFVAQLQRRLARCGLTQEGRSADAEVPLTQGALEYLRRVIVAARMEDPTIPVAQRSGGTAEYVDAPRTDTPTWGGDHEWPPTSIVLDNLFSAEDRRNRQVEFNAAFRRYRDYALDKLRALDAENEDAIFTTSDGVGAGLRAYRHVYPLLWRWLKTGRAAMTRLAQEVVVALSEMPGDEASAPSAARVVGIRAMDAILRRDMYKELADRIPNGQDIGTIGRRAIAVLPPYEASISTASWTQTSTKLKLLADAEAEAIRLGDAACAVWSTRVPFDEARVPTLQLLQNDRDGLKRHYGMEPSSVTDVVTNVAPIHGAEEPLALSVGTMRAIVERLHAIAKGQLKTDHRDWEIEIVTALDVNTLSSYTIGLNDQYIDHFSTLFDDLLCIRAFVACALMGKTMRIAPKTERDDACDAFYRANAEKALSDAATMETMLAKWKTDVRVAAVPTVPRMLRAVRLQLLALQYGHVDTATKLKDHVAFAIFVFYASLREVCDSNYGGYVCVPEHRRRRCVHRANAGPTQPLPSVDPSGYEDDLLRCAMESCDPLVAAVVSAVKLHWRRHDNYSAAVEADARSSAKSLDRAAAVSTVAQLPSAIGSMVAGPALIELNLALLELGYLQRHQFGVGNAHDTSSETQESDDTQSLSSHNDAERWCITWANSAEILLFERECAHVDKLYDPDDLDGDSPPATWPERGEHDCEAARAHRMRIFVSRFLEGRRRALAASDTDRPTIPSWKSGSFVESNAKFFGNLQPRHLTFKALVQGPSRESPRHLRDIAEKWAQAWADVQIPNVRMWMHEAWSTRSEAFGAFDASATDEELREPIRHDLVVAYLEHTKLDWCGGTELSAKPLSSWKDPPSEFRDIDFGFFRSAEEKFNCGRRSMVPGCFDAQLYGDSMRRHTPRGDPWYEFALVNVAMSRPSRNWPRSTIHTLWCEYYRDHELHGVGEDSDADRGGKRPRLDKPLNRFATWNTQALVDALHARGVDEANVTAVEDIG